MVHSQSEMRIERHEDKVVYEISKEGKDSSGLNIEKCRDFFKELKILIDWREDDGGGKADNR